MAKSSLERQIEKQMKQQKQLADKQRREEQKHAREVAREARKESTRNMASSIVNGQPLIQGFRIMDSTSEEVLQCLLKCEHSEEYRISFTDDIFPRYIQMSIDIELEKLVQYGMIGGKICYDNGGILNLLPPAFTYFSKKECALEKQKEHEQKMNIGDINNYGNIVFGNVVDSVLTVDNSICQIQRDIEEKGGDDKKELMELLDEVKELIDNIQTTRTIPKQRKLFQRLNEHVVKHGWFYGAVVQLLGTVAMNAMNG